MIFGFSKVRVQSSAARSGIRMLGKIKPVVWPPTSLPSCTGTRPASLVPSEQLMREHVTSYHTCHCRAVGAAREAQRGRQGLPGRGCAVTAGMPTRPTLAGRLLRTGPSFYVLPRLRRRGRAGAALRAPPVRRDAQSDNFATRTGTPRGARRSIGGVAGTAASTFLRRLFSNSE